MHKHLSVLLLAFSVALAGCSGNNEPADDPTPSAESKLNSENSRLAAVKLGQPIVLDGCQVQAYEVSVSRPSPRMDGSFTLATANCATAKVTATNENCGKGCVHNSLRVERTDRPESATYDTAMQDMMRTKTQAEAEAEAEAEAYDLRLKKRAALQAQIAKLQDELAQELAPSEPKKVN